ncbi:MAG: DUF968 domain-containing protein [Pseudomonadota bacterium]|nr:DUF968 domain-containing protein [Pseudomonadota bacterium]
MTAASERHMQRVRELGCLICQRPASAHNIREERIKDDWLTIPLCPDHHLGAFSIHKSKRQFENIYGSELHLLAETIKKLSENKPTYLLSK